MSDPLLSPSQSSSLLSPSRTLGGNVTSLTSTATPAPTSSQTATPAQPAPTIRGGFEFDDDADAQDNTLDDAQDDDVYGVTDSNDVNDDTGALDPATSGDQAVLDRSSKSPTQENGITPIPVQAVDSPADFTSSVVSNNALSQYQVHTNGVSLQDQTPSADALSALPKSRLAHDVVGMLEDRIKDDPRGDTAAWLELIEEYKNRNKDDLVRATYQRYLEVFPLAVEQWVAFLKWEEVADRKYQMEQIFRKALVSVPSVEVFIIYVNYVRRRNNMQTGDTAAAYSNISKTFEFALKQVGVDKDSGSLWQEYINFLKSGPGTVGGTNWQDSQKMDVLREAYRKVLSVPTSALQTLWKEYEAFEMGINKLNGRKLLSERSPDYMTARTAYTQLQNLTKNIDRTSRPRLPPAVGFAGDIEYQNQVKMWKDWLKWEKEDQLSLKDESNDLYLDRVIFTYKQALMALQFWPEMWYDAADFCFSNGRDEQGTQFLNQGFDSNPESALLAFTLADKLESTTSDDTANDPGAKQRMKIVREPYDKVLDALYAIGKKTESRVEAEIQRIISSASGQTGGAGGSDDVNASNIVEKQAAVDEQTKAVRDRSRAQSDLLSKIITHVWVALMRATRRIQGKGMPNEKGAAGFRTIFNEARKRGQLTPEFYVETALIEWNCYRDATGTRILERGVKLYPDDAYLPLAYIQHLITKDDITNARAVFETTVNRFTSGNKPPSVAKSKPLFVFFHEYESKYGELSQIVRLEKRMSELFPEDPTLRLFSTRYQTPQFDPLSAQPIVSGSQVVPKIGLQPPIEVEGAAKSPVQSVIDRITNVNSPKRPLSMDGDDEDGRPQKIARSDSPFRGTVIRKVPQPVAQNRAPAPLPPAIVHLLSILPKASSYTDIRLNAGVIQSLIKEKHLPAPASLTASRPPLTPQQATPPAWPPQFPQQPPPMIPPPQGYIPQPTPPTQYAQAPFRYP